MKSIVEFLKTNVNPVKYDLVEDKLSINEYIIKKYHFESRKLKSGNIELVTKEYKTKNDSYSGQRFVFHVTSEPFALRRQPMLSKDWDYHPRKMGEFKTIEDMCVYFEKWVEKKLIK